MGWIKSFYIKSFYFINPTMKALKIIFLNIIMWILSLLVIASADIDYLSFRSPLLPTHADKFHTLGDAMPMRKFVRLHPPKQYSNGALVSSNPINLTNYEIELIINSGLGTELEDIGLGIWLTNTSYHIGNIYGLASDFQGIGIFIDISKESLYLTEIYSAFDSSKIFSSPSCHFSGKNKQTLLQIKVKDSKVEVWIKEKKPIKCNEV